MSARTLPADVYDALELSALVYGGIGARYFWDESGPSRSPCCIYGHAHALGDNVRADEIFDAFHATGVSTSASDNAVWVINDRRGTRNQRISFEDWCAEMGVRRGQ